MSSAVVLIAHGTVEALDDLPEFLTNIRRGHPPPPELTAEIRRRYEAIGGRSPLLDVSRAVAEKVERRLGVPVRLAMRLFRPYPEEIVRELAEGGAKRIAVVPLAQHSAHVYGEAVVAAKDRVAPGLEVVCASNWGREPALTDAFASAVMETLARVPSGASPAIVFSAHSLPKAVIDAGDAYEREFRGSVDDVVRAIRARAGGERFSEHVVAFQSQGAPSGRPMEWLGPELRSTLEALAARGVRHVIVAPIGFLADHVEILYDLDIEAKGWADALGVSLYRTASLNASEGLVSAVASVAERLLEER